MNELALFAGAGGGLLASKWLLGWRTVCYVEWETYAVEVLKARIRDGWLDDAPIWDDAFTFDGRPWRGCVDIVTAGFPCQPFSIAGKGRSEADPRNGWPAVIRILREVRPRFALLENVPNLLAKPYARVIFGELAEAGYDAEWDCITAEEVGANHRRERLWILATNAVEREEYVAEQPRKEGVHAAGDGVAQQVSRHEIPKSPTKRGSKRILEKDGRVRAGEQNNARNVIAGEQVADARGCRLGEQGFDKDIRSPDGRGREESQRLRIGNKWPTPTTPRPHDNEKTAGKYIPSQKQKDLTWAVEHYPTPAARDYRSPNSVIGGQLNPDWVEWLMGWPIGWSALEPLGMDKFHEWLRLHGIG